MLNENSKVCANCKHWLVWSYNEEYEEKTRLEVLNKNHGLNESSCEILKDVLEISTETGDCVEYIDTPPDFGCVRFEHWKE